MRDHVHGFEGDSCYFRKWRALGLVWSKVFLFRDCLCSPSCEISGQSAPSLIAVAAISIVGLGAIVTGHAFPRGLKGIEQFATMLSATWCCALFTSSKPSRISNRLSPSPFDVRLDELSKYVWSRHADGSIEYVSPGGYRYLGISPDYTGNFTGYIHPGDIDVRQSAMNRAKETGEPQLFRARYLARTGQYHWFSTSLHTQRDSRGGLIRYFGLLWDIDEKKRWEDDMRARDDIWGTLLKIFPGWTWVERPDGTPEFVSQGALEYSGFTLEQVLGDRFGSVHPDGTAILLRFLFTRNM